MKKTLKTNDSNWRKLKNGEIKAEQIEINALQISFNLGGNENGMGFLQHKYS